MPNFIYFNSKNFTIFAQSKYNVGQVTVPGTIYNKFTSKKFLLKIRIVNTPPRF